MVGRVQREELEPPYVPHELRDGGQATGLTAQLAMHGRQRRKDRGELPRHGLRILAGRAEEEFGELARIADAAEQVFDAVHGAQATRRRPAARRHRLPRARD